jgi:endoglycosylceramidase
LPQGFAQADPTRSCEVFDDLVFQNAEDHATAVGDTLLLSEFGATDDLDTIERMVERADEFMVSTAPATTRDVGPRRHPGSRVRPGGPARGRQPEERQARRALRAYPQVVAGTPESFDFDFDTGPFDLKRHGRGDARRRSGSALNCGTPRLTSAQTPISATATP